jgi:hypothetical protein
MRTLKTYPQSGDVPIGRIVIVKILRDTFGRTMSKFCGTWASIDVFSFSMLLALKCRKVMGNWNKQMARSEFLISLLLRNEDEVSWVYRVVIDSHKHN